MVKSAQITEINNEIQKIPLVMKVSIIYLHHDKGTSICELETWLSEYSWIQLVNTIPRAARQKIDTAVEDKRHNNKGWPRKLILDADDITDKSVKLLPKYYGNFTSKDMLHTFNVRESEISCRTVRRYLLRKNMVIFNAEKRIFSLQKISLPVQNVLINAVIINFWREDITFYLDGTSWIHKGNPAFHAKIFCPRTWRKRSLGLKPTCCAKANKEVSGDRISHFMVTVTT